jgi:NDP-sugar pyrophosphorylase family protein
MYALILAGGRGERLRPLTSDRPKPMILLAGRPILEHQLEWLRGEGVTDVILLCGYLHEVISSHFGDGSRWGLRIAYSVEGEPLGRGGAFKKGFELVPPDMPFVIGTNGDNVTEQPLAPMVRSHRRTGAVATIMLTPMVSPFGIARVGRGSRIQGFDEKPRLPYWLNAGVYVLSRQFFQELPDRGDHETTLFPRLAECGKLYGYKSHAYWKGIDTLKDLSEATAYVGSRMP